MSAVDGTVLAASAIAADGESSVETLAASADGSLLVGGTIEGTASFAGTGTLSRAASSAYVALQQPDGTYAWSSAAEPPSAGVESNLAAAVLRADGTALITGTFDGPASSPTRFGDIALTSPSDDVGAFVAGVSPTGRFTWAQAGGTSPVGEIDTSALAAWADGSALFGVSVESGVGNATFGATTITGDATSRTGGLVAVLDVPVAPAMPTATAGDARAVVAITPLSGSAITRYVVTASPGGRTCAIVPSATSCTVDGLTNGTAHTFTVTAENAAGASPASTASAAVTPVSGAVAPAASLTPRLAKAPRIVRSGSSVSLVSSVRVGAAGGLRQQATYRTLARASRTATACSASVRVKKAGTVTITCRLNAKAKAALRKGALRLMLATTFTESGKTAASTTRRVIVPAAKPKTLPRSLR